jgi:hypothetical protein
MTTAIPEGAQRSEDGNWWWDDSTQEWKPTDQSQGQGQQGAGQQGAGGQPGGEGQQQHQVDWSQYQALGPLFQVTSLDDYFQTVNVDPQVLHNDAGTELGQQLESEFQMIQQAAGDPTQPNVQQLLPLLLQGSQGTPFAELLKQLDQKLTVASDSNADQVEHLAQQFEQDVNQLQQQTGGGY